MGVFVGKGVIVGVGVWVLVGGKKAVLVGVKVKTGEAGVAGVDERGGTNGRVAVGLNLRVGVGVGVGVGCSAMRADARQ